MGAHDPTSAHVEDGLHRKLLSQGSLIFSGFAAAQGLSFLRNSMIGHALSRDDFGIAATITLTIQLLETLSDLGADRQIVQDRDGNTPEFIANAHGVLMARGVVLAALVILFAPALVSYFAIPEALTTLQLAALVPLIKGGLHLDFRRAQRSLDNRPQVLVEFLPQLAAVALTLPALAHFNSFAVAAYLAIAQAVAMVVTSHAIARSPYRIAFDWPLWRKQLRFGVPILLSALPLVAVYHGDRIVIGRVFDMSAVGAYSAALMLTMVPALLVSRVAHALMLPVFSKKVRDGVSMRQAFCGMTELIVVLASCFAVLFGVAGGKILVVAFGDAYSGLGTLVAAFAAMWAIRMTQAVPGMALMAHGQTRPFAIAACIRALALPFVALAALAHQDLATLAAIGAVFEVASLIYIALRLDRTERGLAADFVKRAAFLLPVVSIAALWRLDAIGTAPWSEVVSGIASAGLTAALAVVMMPSLRAMAVRYLTAAMARGAVARAD